jgi:hypothetical protein
VTIFGKSGKHTMFKDNHVIRVQYKTLMSVSRPKSKIRKLPKSMTRPRSRTRKVLKAKTSQHPRQEISSQSTSRTRSGIKKFYQAKSKPKSNNNLHSPMGLCPLCKDSADSEPVHATST